jgi:lipid-A-disaccharide synthase
MKLYLISGEDSGDLHGANLVRALRQHWPALELRGIGGDRLLAEGMEAVAHVRDISFMGFAEVLQHLGTIRRLFRTVRADLRAWQPDAVVLIDYPGFNLRLAPFVKSLGVPLMYYISPQVWAWKKDRVKLIRRYVDRMLVILPFEADFYRAEGVEVSFVGHPLLDEIGAAAPPTEAPPTIALLPGSRRQEIQRTLPVMLELVDRFPQHRFLIAGAPSQAAAFYRPWLSAAQRVELRMNSTYEVLRQADCAVVASGTATLEAALLGVPQVVVYRGAELTYRIFRRLVQVPHISLVNLVMQRPLVPELIQRGFTATKVASELQRLMQPEARAEVLAGYAELRQRLGESGASARAAQVVVATLEQGPPRQA